MCSVVVDVYIKFVLYISPKGGTPCTFGEYVQPCTFGEYVQPCTFGEYVQPCTFGEYL